MRVIFTIAIALLMTASVWAQSPEKMSYQAVVRDASDNLVSTQAVGIQISILQGGASGTPVYVEIQTPTTNANGLVSLEIGTGIVVSGDFTTIDWANDTYFIKTETDPTGGTNYTITGTSQLLSVPYALYAKTSGSSIPGPKGDKGDTGAAGPPGEGISANNFFIQDASNYQISVPLTGRQWGQIDQFIQDGNNAITITSASLLHCSCAAQTSSTDTTQSWFDFAVQNADPAATDTSWQPFGMPVSNTFLRYGALLVTNADGFGNTTMTAQKELEPGTYNIRLEGTAQFDTNIIMAGARWSCYTIPLSE